MNYNLENTNKRLKDLYGSDLQARANFRLVWSEDIKEKQEGEHHLFDDSGNFKGIFNGILEVPKYRYLGIQDRWVLEHVTEAPNGTDDYEPFFVFQTADRKFLPPAWKAIEFLIFNWIHRNENKQPVPTKEAHEELSRNGIYEELFGNETDLTQSFREGSAVVLPGKDF